MTLKKLLTTKENDCKVQLYSVNCCTLVVTEGYQIRYYFLGWTDQSHAFLLCLGCIS